jgi:hypothetical protein
MSSLLFPGRKKKEVAICALKRVINARFVQNQNRWYLME